MKNPRLISAVTVFAVGILTLQVAIASPVTVTANSVESWALDSSTLVKDSFSGTTIPSVDILTATSGNSSSTTNINYSGNVNGAAFSYSFAHSIDNSVVEVNFWDQALTQNSALYFTVNTNTPYTFDGFYTMVGPAGTRTDFGVFLYDVTANEAVFLDDTISQNTANVSFELGARDDGDHISNNFGNVVGTLRAGHDYRLTMQASIGSFDGANITMVAATAYGEVNFTVGTLVPIPSAIWLFGSGLLGLIGISRRHKRGQSGLKFRQ